MDEKRGRETRNAEQSHIRQSILFQLRSIQPQPFNMDTSFSSTSVSSAYSLPPLWFRFFTAMKFAAYQEKEAIKKWKTMIAGDPSYS
jgi:hypothetical protein